MFEGIGVSFGSYFGGMLMESVKGSATFRIFAYGAFFFFVLHVLVQYLLTKLIGPYGKKSANDADNSDKNSNEALETKSGSKNDKQDDGFKEIDLTRM